MASFSNTDTGDKPSGPYYNKNIDTDVTLKEKVEALAKFVSSRKFGMMTTRDPSSGKLVSRCMAVAGTVSKQKEHHYPTIFPIRQWASFAGEVSILTDRDAVKKYYSPTLKAWLGDLGDGIHDGSENDPRIGVLKVKTSSVTYAITDKTLVGRAAEIAKGTITGEVAGVNKLREISEDEVRQWRATASKEA
ncbi:pyridoxamine 5'-phosphate oxidase [Hypoxylon sp. NC0597]|nr:pyridoxamine 5'-phosphate oxidase [Hypoxylon sp. NC0597]